uniref:Uncharacterized protein n=1 Tax=Chaetoceros debilis TaxID=122233 RepID=A0A6S8U802_9STRA
MKSLALVISTLIFLQLFFTSAPASVSAWTVVAITRKNNVGTTSMTLDATTASNPNTSTGDSDNDGDGNEHENERKKNSNAAAAKAMTDYMGRSHAEKLRALKALEIQKNAEIKELKEDIEQASELTKKLQAYQSFMSDYIVNAQMEKARAVKEAESAMTQKYEAKLKLQRLPVPVLVQESKSPSSAARDDKTHTRVSLPASVSVPVPPVPVPVPVPSTKKERKTEVSSSSNGEKTITTPAPPTNAYGMNDYGPMPLTNIDNSVNGSLPLCVYE